MRSPSMRNSTRSTGETADCPVTVAIHAVGVVRFVPSAIDDVMASGDGAVVVVDVAAGVVDVGCSEGVVVAAPPHPAMASTKPRTPRNLNVAYRTDLFLMLR